MKVIVINKFGIKDGKIVHEDTKEVNDLEKWFDEEIGSKVFNK